MVINKYSRKYLIPGISQKDIEIRRRADIGELLEIFLDHNYPNYARYDAIEIRDITYALYFTQGETGEITPDLVWQKYKLEIPPKYTQRINAAIQFLEEIFVK